MKKPNKKSLKRVVAGRKMGNKPKSKGKKRAKPSKRPRYVIGDWKMNPQTLRGAKETFGSIKRIAGKLNHTQVVVCPPFVYLSEIVKLSSDKARPGVQNIFWEQSGSYTGEISASQARDVGADFCIVGHSERRALGEKDADVAKKALAAIRSGMTAVLCVGEKERDLEGGKHLEFLENQIKHSFDGISKRDLSRIILAYEPAWAIGKSDTEAMTGKDLYEMSLYLRKILLGIYGKEAAFPLPILYGGSVTFRNTLDIVKEGEVDGLLVGRQSLEPEGFGEVLKIVDSI